MDNTEIAEHIKQMLSEKRFNHSLGVRDEAMRLARKYGADEEKAALAGIIHDCCKDFPEDKMREMCARYGVTLDEISERSGGLMHGPLGAAYARDVFGVRDGEVLDAVTYHSTGRANMSTLEKIIYVADFIEPCREGYYWLPAMRRLAYDSLDDAVLFGLHLSIIYLLDKNVPIDERTNEARNWLLMRNCD